MKVNRLSKGIALMLCASLLTSMGQLSWKLSSVGGVPFLLLGLAVYGCGALLMILALRFGELSVLYPLLGTGYILSIIFGGIVLHEPITTMKVLGVVVILLGLICLGTPGGKRS